MHEIELGVWKKVFVHLLRILQCVKGAIDKLDKRWSTFSLFEYLGYTISPSWLRFRDVPTFGRDSIRRFTNCVSELKKLGARDYENLLQVSLLSDFPHNPDQPVSSALSLFLRAYYQSPTTLMYWTHCSYWPIGMLWPNFGSTRIYRLQFWNRSQYN